MKQDTVNLRETDHIEIVILADNFSDVLLPGNQFVIRPPLATAGVIPKDTLIAEHGLCLLITIKTGEKSHSFILDSGYSNVVVPHNLNYLGLTLEEVETIVISHSHMDHTGALEEIIKLAGIGKDVIVHPDVFLKRHLTLPTGEILSFPAFPSREDLLQWGAHLIENKKPMLIGDDCVLITGEIARTTDFETGMPGTTIQHDTGPVADTFKDDQSIIINLAGKGLVVISGCAHAGIINTIEYARHITGQEKVFAVIGGFHLSGTAMAAMIEPTIKEIKKNSLQMICPMHCTGFQAMSRLASELPDIFVQSSVGSKIVLM